MISCLGGVQGLVQGLHLLASQTNICDIWHGCKFITWLKKYTSHPSHPFPAVHNDACVQVTFWQAGHKGMYDILITVYELSPGNQVSSSIYSFAILCFLLRSCSRVIKCLCSLHLHVKTNICSDWNMLATCVLHFVGCKSFPTGHNGGRDTQQNLTLKR